MVEEDKSSGPNLSQNCGSHVLRPDGCEADILNANVVMEDEFLPENLTIWKVERSCEGERAS